MPKTLISQRSTGTKVAFGDVVQLSRERSSDPERDGHERFVGLEHIDPVISGFGAGATSLMV